ncbi:MAG: hypothetical protein JNK05_38185 [Myxococcales bacterium]|nr:hypothetical protein [Myxococcales bacterium]
MAVEVRSVESGHAVLVTAARGQLIVRYGPNGLGAASGEGRISADMGDALLGAYDKLIERSGRALVFFDGADVTGADAQLIETAGSWVVKQTASVVTHALVRSKLLELSVSMLNLFSRRSTVELYTDRDKFLGVARREWPGFSLPTLAPRPG